MYVLYVLSSIGKFIGNLPNKRKATCEIPITIFERMASDVTGDAGASRDGELIRIRAFVLRNKVTSSPWLQVTVYELPYN